MTVDRSKFQFTSETVPRGYDEYLVPLLFDPWAQALVAELKPAPGCRALDVATGPGTVARILAAAIGPSGQVAAIDTSPAMITRAESKGDVVGGAPIAYTVGPAEPLPYPDAAFSVVTCQQGLQFFPNAGAALGEMRRVLTSRGRLAASVWFPIADCSVFHAFAETLRATGLVELADLMATPFPHWTSSELADRARSAGFQSVNVVGEARDVVFPGGLAQVLQALTGTPLGPLLAALEPERLAAIAERARECFASLIEPDGAVRGAMRSWVLKATA
ncbi:MAG: class I SAM-dependent methyltransferase [Gemmatimonadales bacterium]